jgi:hypothetical protein
MEIALALRELWRLRLWVVVVAVVALLGSLLLTQRVTLIPPSLHTKEGIEYGAGSSAFLIDSPESAVGDLRKELEPLTARASLVALLIRSEPVQKRISRSMGLPLGTIATTVSLPNPLNPSQPPNLTAGEQASALAGQEAGYQILASPEPEVPIVDIYTQAPSGRKAVALAQATTGAVGKYLSVLQKSDTVPTLSRVRLRALGAASGGDVNSGTGFSITVLAFLAIFIIGLFLILAISRITADMRLSRSVEQHSEPPSGTDGMNNSQSDGAIEAAHPESSAIHVGSRPLD